MSRRTCQSFFGNLLLVFLITAVQFQATFYKANCEVIESYLIKTVLISETDQKIVLELEYGPSVTIPFNNGFREFQITTGRGYERTFLYEGQRLIQIRQRVCNSVI